MLLKELLSIIRGRVVLKIDGIRLKYDDISMVPCKYHNYEITKIGPAPTGLQLELCERTEATIPEGAGYSFEIGV